MANPPVRPAKITIGDGGEPEIVPIKSISNIDRFLAIGSMAVFEEFGVMAILDTFPQLINFDPNVYAYFAEQFTLCGFNLTFSYPETRGHFPSLKSSGNVNGRQQVKQSSNKLKELAFLLADAERQGHDLPKLALEKRQGQNYPIPALTGKLNAWYGCLLVEEVLDFAHNYTIPWRASILLFVDSRLTRWLLF